MDYTPKQLYFKNEGRDKLISGVKKIAQAVKVTMGAKGNTVLIESPLHKRGLTVTKDGATVAKDVSFLDPVENLACRILRNASDETAAEAGDGTTSSIVLSEALILEGVKALDMHPNLNRSDLFHYMSECVDVIISKLKDNSIQLTDELLESVAIISANNDNYVGKLVSEAYIKAGENGMVYFDDSDISETYIDSVDGMSIERGYAQRNFVNNYERDEWVSNNCRVLVSDIELTNLTNQINPLLLQDLVAKKIPLLIIAPCSKGFMGAVITNVLKGMLNWCIVDPPSVGYRKEELMEDIAMLTGATYFNEKSGESLLAMRMEDLGVVSKAIVGDKSTVLVKGELTEERNVAISNKVEQLKVNYEKAVKVGEREFLLKRIASLSGGISMIYVGGMDLEQKELKDRVEDAVLAVRSAKSEGIVAGGGKALLDATYSIEPCKDNDKLEKVVAQSVVLSACSYPAKQILENAGLDFKDIYNPNAGVMTLNYGYNVKANIYGDMIEMGVIDPLKVTRCALKNALSVATTILSTDAIVTMAREIEKE
jgi:chaperonin GroEL